jgi:xanthine permease XanP
VVSAIYLPSALATAASAGLLAVCGMVAFAGVCEIAVASLINRMRKLFPAVVSGVVIIAVGLELGKIAAQVLVHHAAAHAAHRSASFMTAACAVGAMTALGIWARGLPKLFCSLIGILVGYAAAGIFGTYPQNFYTEYLQAAYVAVPDPGILSVAFSPAFVTAFAIAGLASGLRVIGVLTTCQQMNDAAWRRPDMKNIEAGVRADGIGCAVGGLLGAPGMSASPSLRKDHWGVEPQHRLVRRRLAYGAIVSAEICWTDREYAPSGNGCRAVLQWRDDVRCRSSDCGEPAHYPFGPHW